MCMFSNIGGKIKRLAMVICWIGIISSIISGIYFCAEVRHGEEIGIPLLILGPFFSWIGSFIAYGLGELIECASDIRNMMREDRRKN